MNKIKIISNLDLDKLNNNVQRLFGNNKNSAEVDNIYDVCLLVIHLLTPNSRYFEETKKDAYFKKLYSKILNDNFGNTFSDVKKVLMDATYPIIESDGKKYTDGRSTRYKLCDTFFFCADRVTVEGKRKYIEKYHEIINNREKSLNTLDFLKKRMTTRITIDNEAQTYISQFLIFFKGAIENLDGNIYDIEKLNQTFEIIKLKFSRDLSDIRDGNYHAGMSESNHRFNSVFSGLKRELRYFIKIDGEKVGEVDKKASQPYYLNTMLKADFYKSKGQGSFYSIFPEFYKEFTNTKKKIAIDKNNLNYVWGESNVINDKQFHLMTENFPDRTNCYRTVNGSKYYLYNNLKTICKSGVPPHPYMCGNIEKIHDLRLFRNILYSYDFYDFICQDVKFIMEEVYDASKKRSRDISKINRPNVKKGMMFFLNDGKYRDSNSFVKEMKRLFPNVNNIIEFFLSLDFTDPKLKEKYENPFSLLLQRVESYYFLQIGVKKFCDLYPNEPLVTIHDSVIVRESMIENMKNCLRESIEPATGIQMGITDKSKNPFETIGDLVTEYVEDPDYKIKKRFFPKAAV